MIFSSLIGTYLDLYLVGKGLYSFPKRPFPDIFSINISFTLIVLPVLVGVYLIICDKLNNLKKMVFILSISLMMTVIEKQSEVLGFFEHHDLMEPYFFYLWIYFLSNLHLLLLSLAAKAKTLISLSRTIF